jgi:aspartate aminotransferase-like enzyme
VVDLRKIYKVKRDIYIADGDGIYWMEASVSS